MKKYQLLFFIFAFIAIGCQKIEYVSVQPQPEPASTEFFRSQEFHQKYKLSAVVVFNRHHIRAPMAAPGSFISKVTPYTWHDFGVNASELTTKGGVLENINGQFFHKWLVNEGLFSENAVPSDNELFVLSNSMQRTIASARYFVAGFMPMQDVPVHHEGEVGKMDPNFSLALGDDITEEQLALIKAEYEAEYDADGIRNASMALQPNYDLLSQVIDLEDSPAFKDGSFTGFNNHDSEIILEIGKEPRMTASLNDACSVVDALILQYYEEQDPQKEAFGKTLTTEEWHMLSDIIEKRDAIRFHSSFVHHYVSRHQRELIAEALQIEGRKFTFFCGHDTNISNILKSMHTVGYDIPDAIEVSTPIGSEIVFEKWIDAAGNIFIGVNHVYQTLDQLRLSAPLSLTVTPGCVRLKFEGMEPNEDGLYPLNMMIQRLKE